MTLSVILACIVGLAGCGITAAWLPRHLRSQGIHCSVLTLIQQTGYYIGLRAWEWPLPLVVVLISMTQTVVLFQVVLQEKDRQAHWTISRVLVMRVVDSAVYTGLGWVFLYALMSSTGHPGH